MGRGQALGGHFALSIADRAPLEREVRVGGISEFDQMLHELMNRRDRNPPRLPDLYGAQDASRE